MDRIFRNLLTDVTGNTHRTEICIDKLYSPDGPTGRLGLVEFRGFEMPPHAEMSLAQQLLMRALIARFWREPYQEKLVRWGTALHDRFMLPHFVWSDFEDVIADMKDHGFEFDAAWFKPHWEFRFPLVGQVQYEDVGLSLRTALEPWHVMGEEGAVGGTVRYVDSVRSNGWKSKRYGSHPRPPSGAGEWQAGAAAQDSARRGRGRRALQGVAAGAWPASHHRAPCAFDHRDLGWLAQTLHRAVAPIMSPIPAARHEVFPVNAYEAEGRRLARFEPFGFTGGIVQAAAHGCKSRFSLYIGSASGDLSKHRV